MRSIKKSERRKLPAAPFTTSNLQQEASRKLNFNTGKTMQVAQQLYEGVELEGEGLQGLVTYIRTDSTRISDEALLSVREMIKNTYGEPFLPAEPNIYKSRKTAQDAHEAPSAPRTSPAGRRTSRRRSRATSSASTGSSTTAFVSSQMTPAGSLTRFGGHRRRERPYLPPRRAEDEVCRLHRGL